MYELVRAGAQSWYLDCPAKIGVWEAGEGAVYLIDSGGDKEAGRKVRQLLEKNRWTLRGIINTHSNADHIGGNQYLQRQTGCRVFAGGINGAFTRDPVLEPSFLYGGYPCGPLRHKFLLAQPSDAVGFDHPDFPRELELVPLPGHFFDMAGVRCPDGTVFLADCLSSEKTLEKYGFTFLYDVAAYLDTLRMVEKMEAGLFVPSHAEATRDIAPLARINREKVEELAGAVLDLAGEGHSFEDILQGAFDRYGLAMDFQQYVLVGSTIRSYLSWLLDTGRAEAEFTDNRLVWRRKIEKDVRMEQPSQETLAALLEGKRLARDPAVKKHDGVDEALRELKS